MYKLLISEKAKKQLKLITRQYYRQVISETFVDIKENPTIGKLLTRELEKRYSYRVGVYRIIYIVDVKDKTVTVISAGHRGTIYN